MASDLSGLTLKTGPPESVVDTFVDPSGTHDSHLEALNSLLLTLHRSSRANSANKRSKGAAVTETKISGIQDIISGPLGPHLTSSDPKTRYLFEGVFL